jgi:hypothetical protein
MDPIFYKIFILIAGVLPYAIFILILLRLFMGKGRNSSVSYVKNGILLINGVACAIFLIPIIGNVMQDDHRSRGPYAIFWFVSMILQFVAPWLLLFKPIGKKLWILWLLAVFMNFSRLMEKFVIIATSMHQDYLSSMGISPLSFFDTTLLAIGSAIGIALYFIFDYASGTSEDQELLDEPIG